MLTSKVILKYYTKPFWIFWVREWLQYVCFKSIFISREMTSDTVMKRHLCPRCPPVKGQGVQCPRHSPLSGVLANQQSYYCWNTSVTTTSIFNTGQHKSTFALSSYHCNITIQLWIACNYNSNRVCVKSICLMYMLEAFADSSTQARNRKNIKIYLGYQHGSN